MILFNGTEDTLKGRVEGNLVPIGPGECYDCPNQFHANLLLDQFGQRGLVPVALEDLIKGKPTDEVIERARDAYLEFIEAQFRNINEVQTQRNKEGRPGVIPPKELYHLQTVYRTLKGRELALDEPTTNPNDQVQNIAQALVSALQQLTGQKADDTRVNILELAGLPSGSGSQKARAAGAAAKSKTAKE